MNKRIRTIPLPYRNVGKCAENSSFSTFIKIGMRADRIWSDMTMGWVRADRKTVPLVFY